MSKCIISPITQAMVDINGDEVLSKLKLDRYLSHFDAMLAKTYNQLRGEGWSASHLTVAENQKELYKRIKKTFEEDFTRREPSISDEAVADLEKIYTNWKVFAGYHRKFSGLLSETDAILDDEEDIEPVNQTDNENEATSNSVDDEVVETFTPFERAGNTMSTYELADNEVRTLFRMIIKKRNNGTSNEEVVDKDGLLVMADSSDMFRLFTNELSGLLTKQEFEGKLTSDRMKRQFPEVESLTQLIGLGEPKEKLEQILLTNKFFNVFSRPKIEIYMGSMSLDENNEGNRTFRFFTTVKSTNTKIENKFRENFILGNIDEGLLKKYTEIDNSLSTEGRQMGLGRIRLTSVPPIGSVDFGLVKDGDLQQVLKQDLDFLQVLGVKFTGLNLLEADEKEKYAREIHKLASALHESVTDRLAGEEPQDIYEPMVDLKRKWKKTPSDAQYLKRLIQLEANYSRELPSLNSKNANNENQYLVADNNHITVSLAYMNRASNIEELYTFAPFLTLKNNPLFNSSRIKEFLFHKYDIPEQNIKAGDKIEGRTISMGNLSGLEIKVPGTSMNKTTPDLNDRERFILSFRAFAENNVFSTMTTEAKSSFFFLSLDDVERGALPYIQHTAFLKDFRAPDFVNRIISYMDGEIERIKSYDTLKKEEDNIPAAYGQFSIMNGILTPELQATIKQNIINKEEELYNKEDVITAINNYFVKQEEDVRSFIRKEGIIVGQKDELFGSFTKYNKAGDRTSSEMKNAVIKSYIANNFISGVEQTIWLTGDPLFAKKQDFHKRIGSLVSSGNLNNINEDYDEYVKNSTYEKALRENYSLSTILGVEQRDNSKTFLSAVVPDVISTDNGYSDGSIKQEIKDSYLKREGKEIDENLLNNFLKKTAITVSDGASYTHLDYWRESGIRMGWWNPDAEIAYMYESLIFREDNGGLNEEQKSKLDALRTTIYQDVKKYVIPTGKYTYLGGIVNSLIDAKRLDKFAIEPILPSVARYNKKLSDMNKTLIKNQIAYVNHESGSKLYYRKVVKDFNNIKPEDADELATHLLKEQIKTHTEIDDSTTMLTQFVSLLFTNMFSNGTAVNDNVKNLFAQYKDLFKDLHQLQKQEIRGIGIKMNDVGEVEGVDYKTFIDKFLAGQEFDSNIKEAFELNPDGTLKYDLEQSGVLSRVQDFVFGYLDNSLRRYKLQGSNYVVSTPAYMEKPLARGRYTENGTIDMEVRVTFGTSHLPLFRLTNPRTGRPIGDLNTLNSLLEDSAFVEKHKQFLTITFGRSPIDGPHSMGVGRIVHFFEPTAGARIQLPIEFIKASGIDFDIDKEKVYFPHITKYQVDNVNGRLSDLEKKIGEIETVKARIQELEKQYTELREFDTSHDDVDDERADKYIGALFAGRKDIHIDDAISQTEEDLHTLSDAYKEYKNLKDNEREYKINKILEFFGTMLRLPEMYVERAIPNTAEDVLEKAGDNAKATGVDIELPKGSDTLGGLQNIRVSRIFHAVKRLLSVFAKSNTQNEFFKQGGFVINKEFDFAYNKKLNKWIPKKIIHPTLLTEEEAKKVFVKGKVLMGGKFDVLGRLRQWWQSQKLTSALDVTSDPRLAGLNLTMKNIGVVEFLDGMGVPFERVIDFVNIPIIREYTKLRENGKDYKQNLKTIMDRMGLYDSVRQTKRNVEYAEYIKDQKQGLIIGYDKYNGKTYTYDAIINTPISDVPGSEWIFSQINKRMVNHPDLKNIEFDKQFGSDRIKELRDSKEYKYGQKDFEDVMQLLSYYISIDSIQAKTFGIKGLINGVSNKIGSTLEIGQARAGMKSLLDEKFMDREDLLNLVNGSFTSTFNQNKFIEKVINTIFPVITDPMITKGMEKLYSDFVIQGGKSNSTKRILPKVIVNDFINAIMQNFGKYNGQKFVDYGTRLIAKNGENETLVNRLGKLKKLPFWEKLISEYPVLAKFNPQPGYKEHNFYTIFDKQGNPSSSIPHNIEFIDGFDITPQQKIAYANQIKALISPDLYFEADPAASKEENAKTSRHLNKFVSDLLIVSLTQAGVSNGKFSYYDLIPPKFVQAILQPAFEQYKNMSTEDKQTFIDKFTYSEDHEESLDTIEALFKINNPNYYNISNAEETWRGKDYTMNYFLRRKILPAPTSAAGGSKSVQEKITEELADYINKSAIAHLPKERVKTRIATQYIGEGAKGSSTDNYRNLYEKYNLANTGKYSKDDIIYVSSNGTRGGRINPVENGELQGEYKNIDKAIKVGATIVMDTSAHIKATKNYNIGEIALANYMSTHGYEREGDTGIWKSVSNKKQERLINDKDVQTFNAYVTKSKGVKPQEFFTATSTFKQFYNNATGKREGLPTTSKWVLQKTGNYNLIDKESGEVYMEDVDLSTGMANIATEATEAKMSKGEKENIANLKQSDNRWNKYSDEDIQRFIDSVFPNSQIKDLLYHGSAFSDFKKEYKISTINSAGIYFTPNIREAKIFPITKRPGEAIEGKVVPNSRFIHHVILNSIKPISLKEARDYGVNSLDITEKGEQKLKEKGYDGVDQLQRDIPFEEADSNYFVVFEPEQIYILNSDQAISDMDKFVNSDKLGELTTDGVVRKIKAEQYTVTIEPDGRMFYDNGTELTDQTTINKVNVRKELQDGTLRQSSNGNIKYYILSDNRIVGSGVTNKGKETVRDPAMRAKILAKAEPYQAEKAMVLKDGKSYKHDVINYKLLEGLGYAPVEIGKILKEIC